MADDWPRIVARKSIPISPWMSIIEREVQFAEAEQGQLYHAVGQADYLAIVARTADERILIVRQYRPALEAFTWELPAGLVDPGETPADGAQRELLEETGFTAKAIHPLGTFAACAGRLSNRIHSFFIEAGEQVADFKPEPGLTVDAVTPTALATMIATGDLAQQVHVGALMLAELRSLLKLPR